MTSRPAALLILTITATAPSTAWVLDYDGRSTNEIIWDKRIDRLIHTRVPADLSTSVLEALSGPPDPVVVAEHRYVSMSACAAHACLTKGFFWIDTQSGIGLGAVAEVWSFQPHMLRLGSNALSGRQFPAPAIGALTDWMSGQRIRPAVVEFVGRDGKVVPLDPANFPVPHKQPGSGFVTRVERGVS